MLQYAGCASILTLIILGQGPRIMLNNTAQYWASGPVLLLIILGQGPRIMTIS